MILPNRVLKLLSPEDRAKLGKAGITFEEASAKAAQKAESELQKEIGQYLRLREIEFIRPDMRKRSPLPEGWPDVTFAYRGIPVALEVKTDTGKLSAEQVKRHEAMRRNGWIVEIVRGLDEVQSLLRGIDADGHFTESKSSK